MATIEQYEITILVRGQRGTVRVAFITSFGPINGTKDQQVLLDLTNPTVQHLTHDAEALAKLIAFLPSQAEAIQQHAENVYWIYP